MLAVDARSLATRSPSVVVGRRRSRTDRRDRCRRFCRFCFCRSRTDVGIRTYVHPWWNVHGREGTTTSTTRGTRGTRVRRKQLNLVPSLSFSRAVGRASSRRLFLSVSLSLSPLVPAARLFLSGLPAKLNKHSYLHSISGALTSLDNPATDSSSSHVRASSIL